MTTVVDEHAPAPDTDLVLTSADGRIVTSFLAGLRTFFRDADALETKALATLAYAKTLPAKLDTVEQDAAIQTLVKTANADKHGIEAHWKITSLVSQFQKRLVARRQRGVVALEETARIGNALHNRFVEDAKRAAAVEQERLRREAEDKARCEREADLARLEAEAVAREEAAGELSERERMFVDHHVIGAYGGSAARQAEGAGFKDGVKTAARLLSLPKIQQAIRAKLEARALREQAAAAKAAPLEVAPVDVVAPAFTGSAGRTTWSGEVLDVTATVEAFRQGKHGIPADLFTINQAKLTEYARALHERLDLWPGVRAKKSTGVV